MTSWRSVSLARARRAAASYSESARKENSVHHMNCQAEPGWDDMRKGK